MPPLWLRDFSGLDSYYFIQCHYHAELNSRQPPKATVPVSASQHFYIMAQRALIRQSKKSWLPGLLRTHRAIGQMLNYGYN